MFSDLRSYNDGTVKATAPNAPGIYRLSHRLTDGKFYVFYVGQASDLESRLLDHLATWEPNDCVKSKVRTQDCYFRYARVDSKRDRDRIESQQIAEFNPSCNRQS